MASGQPPFAAMTTSRDAPNPLRPYYVPPSIGVAPRNASVGPPSSGSGLGRSARDLLSDLDYGGPLLGKDGASFTELGRKLFDQAVWKYTSVLLAQPFDVAKTILQLRLAGSEDLDLIADGRNADRRVTEIHDPQYDDESRSEESDEDEVSYFTPTRPSKNARLEDESPSRRRARRRRTRTGASSAASTPIQSVSELPIHRLRIQRPDSIMDALSQLWQRSGATGLWKATNATFVYNVLAKALESWTRSLLSALLNLPDPTVMIGGPSDMVASAMGGMDITDSPSPVLSLAIAVAAAGITGLLLSPLDLVRTRLIITPTTISPRAILPSLRLLPSLTPSTTLLPITLLHSSLPTLVTSTTPLFLRHYLRITPLSTPSLYSVSSFAISTLELFCKLPLETVLRRAQVHVLRQNNRQVSAITLRKRDGPSSRLLDTIVETGPYRGIVGTMWSIVRIEGGERPGSGSMTALHESRGQSQVQKRSNVAGVSGLFRGWKVGMWGLVGVWGASALGSGSGTSEF